MPDADGHLFLLTPGELCQLAESAGLTVERLNVWGTPMLTGHAAFRYLAEVIPIKSSIFNRTAGATLAIRRACPRLHIALCNSAA